MMRGFAVVVTAQSLVTISSSRTDVRVTFPNGAVYSAPLGTLLLDFIRAAYPPDHPEQPILAAVLDDAELRELTIPVQRDMLVKPMTLSHSDGHRIYRRSLCFLLTTAAGELFPGVKIAVEHSLPSGGMHCEVLGRANFKKEELKAIEDRMRAIIDEDAPIVRKRIPLADAIA